VEKYEVADLNGDEIVSITDFGLWLDQYRANKEGKEFKAYADIDGDSYISLTDFSSWLKLWREYKVDPDPYALGTPIGNSPVPNLPDEDIVEPGESIVASGGTVTSKSGYTYHTFTEDGTFSIEGLDKVDVLIVGGGGGGGADSGGGGGAGGVRVLADVNVTDVVNIVVGKGGTPCVNGTKSSFGENGALGGGAGASGSQLPDGLTECSQQGQNGGSGGGGAGYYDELYKSLAGLGTTDLGHDGYKGHAVFWNNTTTEGEKVTDDEGNTIEKMMATGYPPCRIGGGGGGAGGSGEDSNGGIGISVWGNYYGGGGAGGRCNNYQHLAYGKGGLGGGGSAPDGVGVDGFGGGGAGGKDFGGVGFRGGNGVVIVRYMVPGKGIQLDDVTPAEQYYRRVKDEHGYEKIIIDGPPKPPAGYEVGDRKQYYYEIVDDGNGIQHIIISGPPERP
jgi:hypothetical protein